MRLKGSDCNAVGEADTGDGQGNCNLTRTTAATALVNWLSIDPTGSGDPDFLIIGDLNSYAMEDPITAIQSAGATLTVSVSQSVLFPPNHKYVTVTATVNVSDTVDPDPTVTLVSVTSNEPDNRDIRILNDFTFRLRAERSELGSARVYRRLTPTGTAR